MGDVVLGNLDCSILTVRKKTKSQAVKIPVLQLLKLHSLVLTHNIANDAN